MGFYLNGQLFDFSPEEGMQKLLAVEALKELVAKADKEKEEALEAQKKTFVKACLDYEGGCIDAKIEFLEQNDLEEFLPKGSAKVSFTFNWLYGNEPDESEVIGFIEGLPYDFSTVENVKVQIEEWNSVD